MEYIRDVWLEVRHGDKDPVLPSRMHVGKTRRPRYPSYRLSCERYALLTLV
jgi:hypothetical protein